MALEGLINKIFKKEPQEIGTLDAGNEEPEVEPHGTNLYEVNTAGFVQEVIESDIPVIVDCYTQWCGPCNMMAPIFQKVAADYDGKVKFVKVDLDRCGPVGKHFSIRGVPTLLLIKDGMKVNTIVGFSSDNKIRKAVDKLLEN